VIIKRDERILDARYLSREGDTGTRWWSAMRGRNRLSVFNDAVVSSEVVLGGRPGQLVFSGVGGDSATGVRVPGDSLPATGVRVVYAGFSGPIGTYINRTFPTPPSGTTDSVRIDAAYPASLSWEYTGFSGGSLNHPTQVTTVNYYGAINGGGSLQALSENWRCNLTALGGSLFKIEIQPYPNSAQWSWGRAASCALGGTVSGGSRTITLSTNGTDEAFVNGGTFTLVPTYS
jgi:hypothetical protein